MTIVGGQWRRDWYRLPALVISIPFYILIKDPGCFKNVKCFCFVGSRRPLNLLNLKNNLKKIQETPLNLNIMGNSNI